MNEKKKRIEWLDALRGFAIILVVFNHIELFGFGNQPGDSIIKDYIATFFMPLFFGISGYSAYRDSSYSSYTELKNIISKKVIKLFVPTIVFGVIFSILIYPSCREDGYSRIQSIGSMIIDPFKHGYWFTLVLLEMFCIYYLIDFYLKKCCTNRRTVIWGLISLLFYILSFCTSKQYIVENGYFDKTFENYFYLAFNITSLNKTFYYFQWFMFGMLLRKSWNNAVHYIEKGHLMTVTLLLYFPLLLIYRYTHFSIINNIVLALLGYVAIILLFSFFYLYQDAFFSDKILGKGLQSIGRKTLDIYMIHYFFIPSLLGFGEWLKTPNNDIATKFLPELMIGAVLSLGVICISLLVSNILRMSPFLSRNLFGSKKE